MYPYSDFQDERTVQDELVFKGDQLVVPIAMCKKMMAVVHLSHIGIERYIRQAREVMLWPRTSSELKAYISKRDVCMAPRTAQGKEPIVQHEFCSKSMVEDGCRSQRHTLLVVCDYCNNLIEVDTLTKANTTGISKALKAMFARYRVPDVEMSDIDPQFQHVTSSPHYPQTNGKA